MYGYYDRAASMKHKIVYRDGTYDIVSGLEPSHIKNLLRTKIVKDVIEC